MWFVLPHIYPLVQYDVYSQEPQLLVEPLAGKGAGVGGALCRCLRPGMGGAWVGRVIWRCLGGLCSFTEGSHIGGGFLLHHTPVLCNRVLSR